MSRVPPHDLTAEESVLASCLVSRANIDQVLGERIGVGDFYKPAHSAIFAAITDLYDQPAPVDVVSTCARLESTGKLATVGGRRVIEDLLISGSTLHPSHYARVVAGYAHVRRVIAWADELSDLAYAGDLDDVLNALATADTLGTDGGLRVDPPMEASELTAAEPKPDWVVRHLLARLEVVLFVAEPGAGKTTLMRQIAACLASGLHPFTRLPVPPVRTLTFDFQDPPGPAIRATRDTLAAAGDSYRKTWWVELRQQGVDLTSPRDQAWFDAKIAAVGPDLVLAGPLYNMLRGSAGRSKQSEETAEIAGRFLMDVMVRHNCAVILEAHAPHGEELRVRGSKYWEDFAAFGFGLRSSTDENGRRLLRIDRFRGDREMGRQWPRGFLQGRGRWPWDADHIPPAPPDDESWVNDNGDEEVF